MLSHGLMFQEKERLQAEAYESALAGLAKLANPQNTADLHVALLSLTYACANLQGAIVLQQTADKALS